MVDMEMSRLAGAEGLGALGADDWEVREAREKQSKAEGKSEYSKFETRGGGRARYRGDIMYEGPWRADRVRQGGNITLRQGVPQPHLHQRWFVHSSDNHRFMELNELPDREHAMVQRRSRTMRLSLASALSKRRKQEKENLKSYEHWRNKARLLEKHMMRRNAMLRQDVQQLKVSLAIGEDEFRDGLALRLGLTDLRAAGGIEFDDHVQNSGEGGGDVPRLHVPSWQDSVKQDDWSSPAAGASSFAMKDGVAIAKARERMGGTLSRVSGDQRSN